MIAFLREKYGKNISETATGMGVIIQGVGLVLLKDERLLMVAQYEHKT